MLIHSDFITTLILSSGFSLTPIESNSYLEEPSFFLSNKILIENDIVVLDGYNFTANVQKEFKKLNIKLVSIDDMHSGHFYSDVVINHNPSIDIKKYDTEPYTNVFIGLEYALVRKVYYKQIPKERKFESANTVFICFGGADPYNLTLKCLKVCEYLKEADTVNVVTGGAYIHKEELAQAIANSSKRINHYSGLSSEQLVDVMEKSYLAIAPSSTISFELFCVGVNLITGYFVDNQMSFSNYINDNHLGLSVGSFLECSESELLDSIQKNYFKPYYLQQKKQMANKKNDKILEIFNNI